MNMEEISGRDYFSNKYSPFSNEEVSTLVDLIDQYKSIIFDKSISPATNYAKNAVWTNITKTFNMKGFSTVRDVDCIKLKWDEMKNKARKRTNNFTAINYNEYDELTARIIVLIAEFENAENDDGNNDAANRNHELNQLPKSNRDSNRILNFTPEECQRLLQCVKAEEKGIFCPGTSAHATRFKNNAWTRVSLSFNRGNVHKRSTKALKTKFENMKRLACGSVDNGTRASSHDRIRTSSATEPNNVKEEDNIEEEFYLLESEPDNTWIEAPIQMDEDNSQSPATAPDPLVTAYSDKAAKHLNTDVQVTVTQSDIMRLKAEILQCDLETAKLKQLQERQTAASEQTERHLRAKLLALQLREARLNAWTAEQRAAQVGATGEVLQYRQDERAAQDTGEELLS